MDTQFLSHFLPTELLEHFTITNIEEFTRVLLKVAREIKI